MPGTKMELEDELRLERARHDHAMELLRIQQIGDTYTRATQALTIINGGGLVAVYTVAGHVPAPSAFGLSVASFGFVAGLVLTIASYVVANFSHALEALRRIVAGYQVGEHPRMDTEFLVGVKLTSWILGAALVCFVLGALAGISSVV